MCLRRPLTWIGPSIFYVNKVNFNADYDERPGCGFRFVQLTPPGLACSICLGEGLTNAAPCSAPKLQMVVANIEAAHAQFAATGVGATGVDVTGVDVHTWGSFVYFADPDGNKWAVQSMASRSNG